MSSPARSLNDFAEIPNRVWADFLQRGGLQDIRLLKYYRPLKSTRLDPAAAQQVVNQQRLDFKRLVVELFQPDSIEEFIFSRLKIGNFPFLSRADMNEKFSRVLQESLSSVPGPNFKSFDLVADREDYQGKGYFDLAEYRYAVQLMKCRPAVALSVLFLRKYLVEFAFLLQKACWESLNEEQQKTFRFFLDSWNQNAFVKILYPAIAVQLYPSVDVSEEKIELPEFDSELIRQVIRWLTTKHFFRGKATAGQHGYDADLSCAATGFLNEALGQRNWLCRIFSRIVEDQSDPLMVQDFDRVRWHANRLEKIGL